MKKLVIIGIDGATFDIIGPGIERGDFPVFKALMERGSWGELKSTVPPLSPVAWTSIATGVEPAKHGILDFVTKVPRTYAFDFTIGAMRKTPALWSILSQQGRKVGVMNMPCSFPPDEVDGYMIAGIDTPRNSKNAAWPDGLMDDLKKNIGSYMIDLADEIDPRGGDNRIAYDIVLDELHRMIDNRLNAVLYLMGKYDCDFLFPVFIALDRAQHFFWHFMADNPNDSQKLRDSIIGLYKHIDQAVGKILERISPDTTVILLSDHGFGPLKGTVFLNTWLRERGYLMPLEGLASIKSRIHASLPKYMTRIRRFIPKAIRQAAKAAHAEKILMPPPSLMWIDWRRTKVFFEGQTGSLYVNLKGREPFGVVEPGEEYEALLEILGKQLITLMDPKTGEPVVKEVRRGKEIFGQELASIPDLLVVFNEGYEVGTNFSLLTQADKGVFGTHSWTGCHHPRGIFIAAGPGIRKNNKFKGARMIDVTPTSLFDMGLMVPSYMDGKVLTAIYEDAYLKEHAPEYASLEAGSATRNVTLSEQEQDELSKRLKALGYL